MSGAWRVFHDLDEVRELIGRYDSDHGREALGREGFRWAIQHVDATVVQLGRVRSSAQRLRGMPSAFLLHIVQDGRVTYGVGQRAVEAFPGQAVLLAPGETFASSSGGGTTLSVRVREDSLRDEISRLCEEETHDVGALERAVPLHTSTGRHLLSLLPAGDLDPGSGGIDALRRGEAEVASALAQTLIRNWDDRVGERRAEIERRRMRQVEEWIDAHFTRPVTLGELCRVSGLPARSLHRAFLRHRGQPPMRHVTQRRLAEARRRLLEGRPGDSVMQVAFESGFNHLGRFAGLYRATYGESPSQTLSARVLSPARRRGQKA